jgi:hypothetical protein
MRASSQVLHDTPSCRLIVPLVWGATVTALPALAVAPANDACAGVAVIAALPFTDSIDTVGATHDAADPALSCVPEGGGKTVWYQLTPPADGTVCVRTCGSDYDTAVAAFNGTCDALVES